MQVWGFLWEQEREKKDPSPIFLLITFSFLKPLLEPVSIFLGRKYATGHSSSISAALESKLEVFSLDQTAVPCHDAVTICYATVLFRSSSFQTARPGFSPISLFGISKCSSCSTDDTTFSHSWRCPLLFAIPLNSSNNKKGNSTAPATKWQALMIL